MKAKSTEVADQIELALKRISIADGYLTDLGDSVHRGFYAHVLAADGTQFPAVVIHPATERPSSLRGERDGCIESEVPLVMACRLGSGTQAYMEIESVLADTRRALVRGMQGIKAVTGRDEFDIGVADPDISRDSSLVMYAMTVSVKYNEHY